MSRANRAHSITDPLTRRNVTIPRSLQARMRKWAQLRGINWSTVITAYLKVYIYDLEQQEDK